MKPHTFPATQHAAILAIARPGVSLHFTFTTEDEATAIEAAANGITKRLANNSIEVTLRSAAGRKKTPLRIAMEAMPLDGTLTISEPITQSIRTMIGRTADETGHKYRLRGQELRRIK